MQKGLIAKQGFNSTIAIAFGMALGICSTLYLFPKYYSVEQNGLKEFFIQFGALLSQVAQLGTNYSIWKFFPKFKNDNGNHGFGFWLLIIPLVGIVLVSILLMLWGPQLIGNFSKSVLGFENYFYLIYPLIFFFTYNYVFETMSSTLGNVTVSAINREIIIRAFNILFLLLFAAGFISIRYNIFLFSVAYAVTAIVNFVFINRKTKMQYLPDMQFIRTESLAKPFASYTGAMVLTFIIGLVAQRLDYIMISAITTNAMYDAGIYSVVIAIILLMEIPQRGLQSISSATVAHALHDNDMEKVKRIYQKTSLNLLLFGVLIYLAIYIGIDLVYYLIPKGEHYSLGRNAVLILGIGKLFTLLNGNSTSLLYLSKHYYLSTIVTSVFVALGIGLNIYLIPKYGLMGVAGATAISWIVSAQVMGYIIHKLYGFNPYNKKIFTIFALLILGFTVVYFCKLLPLYLSIAAGIAVWLLIIVLVYRQKISSDFNSLIEKLAKKIGVSL